MQGGGGPEAESQGPEGLGGGGGQDNGQQVESLCLAAGLSQPRLDSGSMGVSPLQGTKIVIQNLQTSVTQVLQLNTHTVAHPPLVRVHNGLLDLCRSVRNKSKLTDSVQSPHSRTPTTGGHPRAVR